MPGIPASSALSKARLFQHRERDALLKLWGAQISVVNELIESSANEGKTIITISPSTVHIAKESEAWDGFCRVISDDLFKRGYTVYGKPDLIGSIRISWEIDTLAER